MADPREANEPREIELADDAAAIGDADEAGDLSEARFVPLHNLGSPAEAEMVNDILRQNGVRSAVQSGGADAFSPLLSVTSPGAVVLVDERDHERAQEIYASFFGADTTPLTGTTIAEDAENE